MKDFAFCFSDLAKVFSCFDTNTPFSDPHHKRANTQKFNNESGTHYIKPIKGQIDKLSTSGATVNNTMDNEISSTNQNSIWNSSISDDPKRLHTSIPSTTKRKLGPVCFKPNVMRISENRKLKRLTATQENEKRSPRSQIKSTMTSRIKNYEHRLFQNLKNEEIKQAKCIEKLQTSYAHSLKEKLKNNYYEAKRKSISGNDGRLSPSNDSHPFKKESRFTEDSSISSGRSKGKYKKLDNAIPDIQIKVGVQNNHYSFFNTINESDEDDENVVTVIGLKKNKLDLGYKFKKTQGKEYKVISPRQQESNPMFPSMGGWSKADMKIYKRHNIEPPIDLRSQSRRYRETLQTRMKKKVASKDRVIQRGY